ncbi:MAG: DNA polymerase III subunit gamma/tau [Desulfovibrio sp.]|nr:DNA polymerase III subunit gamma/tau [Desulfovibrio sp.]
MDNVSKKLALAARYRPQTFAEVAGQDMVKAVLSRSCAEDRPACAYLFSGTRGVGKTTVARIFAKALNCERGPAREPCNSCSQCTKIMQGSHVDVVEIDGASNNKIDDVRALREIVGYAPMEGRYKIFIIDEAHMLTSQAFNALLKTLEEPPPRVIFIMATTEAHKFPVTIVSRCQHFTFRHLNEEELISHLASVLQKESLAYDEDAIRLIAKRAQGSVRDSMSLLDQTLALGNDRLSLDITREVLGLAGQEFFEQLFAAMHAADCAGVISLTRGLLRRGVDIGFFLRELAEYLRSFFLFAQSGSQILSVLQLSPAEQTFVTTHAGQFSPAHLHAAWQLVLDGQRGVVQSTEPATALELLLLNLALLPRLLPLAKAPLAQGVSLQTSGSAQTSGFAGGDTGGQPAKAPATSARPIPRRETPLTAHVRPDPLSTQSPLEPLGKPAKLSPASLEPHPVPDASGPATASLQAKAEEAACQVENSDVSQVLPQSPKSDTLAPEPLRPESAIAQTTRGQSQRRPGLTSTEASGNVSQAEESVPTPRPEPASPDSQAALAALKQVSQPVQTSEEEALDTAESSEISQVLPQGPKPGEQDEASLQAKKVQPAKPTTSAYEKSVEETAEFADDNLDTDESLDDADIGATVQIKALDWPSFCRFYLSQMQGDGSTHFTEHDLRGLEVLRLGSHVTINPPYQVQYDRLQHCKERLQQALVRFLHDPRITLEIVRPVPASSTQDLAEQLKKRDELQPCFSILDTVVERCRSY